MCMYKSTTTNKIVNILDPRFKKKQYIRNRNLNGMISYYL